MVNIKVTPNEKEAIRRLVIQNRDSSRLQNISDLSYLESIKLINKLNEVV